MRRKGKPKGAEQTVIGVGQKRKREGDKPIKFWKKPPKEKDRGMHFSLLIFLSAIINITIPNLNAKEFCYNLSFQHSILISI